MSCLVFEMLNSIRLFTKLRFQRITTKRLRLPNAVPKGNYQKEHEVHSDEHSSVWSGPVDTVRDSCREGKHSCGQISKEEERTNSRSVLCKEWPRTSRRSKARWLCWGCSWSTRWACHSCSVGYYMDRVGVGMGGKRATPSSQAICDSCMLGGGKTISLVISHPDAGLLAFQNTQYQESLATFTRPG